MENVKLEISFKVGSKKTKYLPAKEFAPKNSKRRAFNMPEISEFLGKYHLEIYENGKAAYLGLKPIETEKETSKVSNKKISFSKLLELHNLGKISAEEFETAVQKLHG